MDEVIIAGKKYISSKRAARTSGYAPDYIGQLVRESKLHAVKVGRAWFVAEQGLQTLIAEPGDLSSVVQSAALPATWSPVIYMKDDAPLYPVKISDRQENNVLSHDTDVEPVSLNKIQSPKRSIGGSLDGIKKVVPEIKQIKTVEPVAVEAPRVRRQSRMLGYFLAVLVGVLIVAFFVFLISIFY
ncbi:MAG: hypothetical protein RLZZ283_13 [Candidatus Parcubacteria bacterium]|jgi:hypothetical protein